MGWKSGSLRVLNEPFVLWFLSTVLVGFISWQYAQIQKQSIEQKFEEQALRRANLELKLLLSDVEWGSKRGEDLTIGHLQAMLVKVQYNASPPMNQFYFPSALNVMLEIDSRVESCGLEMYQSRLYEYATTISVVLERLWHLRNIPNKKISNELTEDEKVKIEGLGELTSEILTFYSGDMSACRSVVQQSEGHTPVSSSN